MSALPIEPPDESPEQLDRIEAMLTDLHALVEEVRPLVAAASEELRTKGFMGMVTGMMGGMFRS